MACGCVGASCSRGAPGIRLGVSTERGLQSGSARLGQRKPRNSEPLMLSPKCRLDHPTLDLNGPLCGVWDIGDLLRRPSAEASIPAFRRWTRNRFRKARQVCPSPAATPTSPGTAPLAHSPELAPARPASIHARTSSSPSHEVCTLRPDGHRHRGRRGRGAGGHPGVEPEVGGDPRGERRAEPQASRIGNSRQTPGRTPGVSRSRSTRRTSVRPVRPAQWRGHRTLAGWFGR
jgi:hypothetical protein